MQTVTWHEHEVHCAPPPAAISGAMTVAVGHKSTLASAGLAATGVRTPGCNIGLAHFSLHMRAVLRRRIAAADDLLARPSAPVATTLAAASQIGSVRATFDRNSRGFALFLSQRTHTASIGRSCQAPTMSQANCYHESQRNEEKEAHSESQVSSGRCI